MRALALIAVLLIACAPPPEPAIAPSPTPAPGVLEVTALLDLSGGRAPRGDAQRNALELWVDHDRARGGGRVPVRLSVVDVASSDAKLLTELHRASVNSADAVIVGVPVDLAVPGFAQAADAAELPLLLTLPVTEPVGSSTGRWIFALAPTPEQIARRVIGIPPPRSLIDTFVLTRAGPRHAETAAVLAAYRQAAAGDPAVLKVNGATADEIQTVARVVEASARRVHLAGPPRDWSALAQALKQLGRPTATFVLSFLTEPNDGGDFREGIDAVWPAPRHLSPGAIVQDATAEARRQFVRSYTDRHGAPTAHAAAAWDALSALAVAADRAGPDDRAALRDRLESTSFAGVATTYAFSVTRHAGYAGDDLALFRWSNGAAVIDTRP